MHSQVRKDLPEGALAVRSLGEDVWEFEYPRLTNEAYDTFHEAIELWRVCEFSSAEEAYRRLIDQWPEFIDVYHHLALLLDETERCDEAFQMWQDTVALGLSYLPEQFEVGRDLLPWLHLDNRPFLRAYHALGLEYLETGAVGLALQIFDNILAMNPDDNQGVRALAIHCYFRLKRPKDVLQVCERYDGDVMEQVLYGRVLALYQLGRVASAQRALREAVDILPLVAQELLKSRHRPPKGLRPGHVTLGGADQAYYYWTEQGGYWKRTPGAIEWLRECVQEARPASGGRRSLPRPC